LHFKNAGFLMILEPDFCQKRRQNSLLKIFQFLYADFIHVTKKWVKLGKDGEKFFNFENMGENQCLQR
jgi:hypothetical protein